MENTDLTKIFNKTSTLAGELISEEVGSGYLEKINRYSNFMKQFVQIVGSIAPEERGGYECIDEMLAIHQRLEKKLENDKTGIKQIIQNINSNLIVKKKYYGNQKSTVRFDRKG
jgi:hypothetical protein